MGDDPGETCSSEQHVVKFHDSVPDHFVDAPMTCCCGRMVFDVTRKGDSLAFRPPLPAAQPILSRSGGSPW